MGMFDWLKSKRKLNDVMPAIRDELQFRVMQGDYKGHVPPQPIPEPVAVVPKNISEPAYTLAEMLGRDEWEYVYSSGYDFGCGWYDKHLVNVFKENVKIRIRHEAFYFEGALSWCTKDEKEFLLPLIDKCKWRCAELLNEDKRDRFKKTLGVQ